MSDWVLDGGKTSIDFALMVLIKGGIAIAMASHISAMCTDPGTVPPYDPLASAEDGDAPDGAGYCKKCSNFKPNRAHHCSTCGTCVQLMDHHCPWVNNCVGKYNRKYFVLFVLWVMVSCIYVVIITGHRIYYCIEHAPPYHRRRRHHRRRHDPHSSTTTTTTETIPEDILELMKPPLSCDGIQDPTAVLALMMLMLFALLFGIFTMVMLFEQLTSIFEDVTTIESFKGSHAKKDQQLARLSRYFGPMSMWWLVPTRPLLRDDAWQIRYATSDM